MYARKQRYRYRYVCVHDKKYRSTGSLVYCTKGTMLLQVQSQSYSVFCVVFVVLQFCKVEHKVSAIVYILQGVLRTACTECVQIVQSRYTCSPCILYRIQKSKYRIVLVRCSSSSRLVYYICTQYLYVSPHIRPDKTSYYVPCTRVYIVVLSVSLLSTCRLSALHLYI